MVGLGKRGSGIDQHKQEILTRFLEAQERFLREPMRILDRYVLYVNWIKEKSGDWDDTISDRANLDALAYCISVFSTRIRKNNYPRLNMRLTPTDEPLDESIIRGNTRINSVVRTHLSAQS